MSDHFNIVYCGECHRCLSGKKCFILRGEHPNQFDDGRLERINMAVKMYVEGESWDYIKEFTKICLTKKMMEDRGLSFNRGKPYQFKNGKIQNNKH